MYHVNEGDFGIVFPNIIHHYQVFSEGENDVVLAIKMLANMKSSNSLMGHAYAQVILAYVCQDISL